MEVYSLTYLPDEVLEVVFKNLNGTAFVNCGKTCRRLHAVTLGFESHCCIWKRFCLMEVEPYALMELLRNKTVDFFDSKTFGMVEAENRFWKKIYVKWFCTQFIGKYSCTQNQVDCTELRSAVHCIKISGDCLITGHGNGSIFMWNAFCDSPVPLRRLSQHKKSVLDLALVDLFNFGNYGSDDFLLEHHHILSGGQDRIIMLIQLHCLEGEDVSPATTLPELTVQIDKLSVFNNTLIAKSLDEPVILYVYKITAISVSDLELSLCCVIDQFHDMKPKWVSFWANQLILLTDDMIQYTFCLSKGKWISRRPTVLMNESDIHSSVPMTVRSCYMFQKNIVVFLTMNNYLCLSNDGENFRAYSTLSSMRGSVTCVAIIGKNIAFGTNMGSIYLYNFKDNKNLSNLNLKQPIWKRQFADSSIISIDFWLDTSSIHMAAATFENSYVFRWTSQSTQLSDSLSQC